MARVIKGTKDLNRRRAARVIKATGGTDKIRCTKCPGLAVATPDGQGGIFHKCGSCGATYRFTKL